MDAFVKRLPKISGKPDSTVVKSTAIKTEDDGPPAKRPKVAEIPDSDVESDLDDSVDIGSKRPGYSSYKVSVNDLGGDGDDAEDAESPAKRHRVPDIENVQPLTQEDEEVALKDYDAAKASQRDQTVEEPTDKRRPTWLKGRSSIYVDAFNLALDTVLEDEAHLFDDNERHVFRVWHELDYEAQYLYVRLFLRKTASWHRQARLGYYSDISDMDRAVGTLQELHVLPTATIVSPASEHQNKSVEVQEPDLEGCFTFADSSSEHLCSVEEAANLLLLDELKALAKDAKVQGRNKSELIRSLVRMCQQQTGLASVGLSRQNSMASSRSASEDAEMPKPRLRREESGREQHFLDMIMNVLGPCIRLTPDTFRLFERVHLVFYRSIEWTEKSLTTIILSKIARRHFPSYIVCRTATIFQSRSHLLEFEGSIRLEAEVDNILEFNGPPGEAGYQRIMDIFEQVQPRWNMLVEEERHKDKVQYEMGEGAYLRRFTAAHSYTRIIHKALHVLARRKEHLREYAVLCSLLSQELFHLARRGSWYQRKALLEEHYMPQVDEHPRSADVEMQKKHWKRVAIATCEAGLQDPNTHLIFHYDLQKRLLKLEKKLRIPKRLQHDFGHVRLAKPLELTVRGIQLVRDVPIKPGRVAASTKTIWLDELDTGGECSVEEMCLSHFRNEGWKGYHAEGGIMRTLFAYLFFDILFLYIPNVFQTAYQTCPLDLHTDAFFPVRASEINHRLVDLANGEAENILRRVWEQEHEKRTAVVGLKWDFDVDDLAELVRCFKGSALASICKVIAQEYSHRGGGMPDLILWRTGNVAGEHSDTASTTSEGQDSGDGEVMFAEVKSANDRLSDTQRLWIHVLTGAGVKVALCNAVAREVRDVT